MWTFLLSVWLQSVLTLLTGSDNYLLHVHTAEYLGSGESAVAEVAGTGGASWLSAPIFCQVVIVPPAPGNQSRIQAKPLSRIKSSISSHFPETAAKVTWPSPASLAWRLLTAKSQGAAVQCDDTGHNAQRAGRLQGKWKFYADQCMKKTQEPGWTQFQWFQRQFRPTAWNQYLDPIPLFQVKLVTPV